MRMFIKFNEENILTQMVVVNNDSSGIDETMEEVTDPDLINVLQVNHFKKVSGVIMPLNENEINNLQQESLIYRLPIDKQEKTIV